MIALFSWVPDCKNSTNIVVVGMNKIIYEVFIYKQEILQSFM